MLYHSLIQPYFQYCNIIWATHHTQHIELLFRKQKKAVRIISFSKWNSHTKPLFVNHRILTLSNINIFQVCCFMYKVRYNLFPSFCINWFLKNNEIHHHCTGNAIKFYVISHRLTCRSHIIKVLGVKLLNNLPTSITESLSLPVCECRCKHYLINND